MATLSNPSIPVLPLRDVVVYPNMAIPLFVGRDKSIRALDNALLLNKQILLLAQTSPDIEDPELKDLHRIGAIATILQLLKLPDGTVKVLVEGKERVEVTNFNVTDFISAQYKPLREKFNLSDKEKQVLISSVLEMFEQYAKLNRKISPETVTSLTSIQEPGRLADTIAAHLTLKLHERQQILEMTDISKRLEHLMAVMEFANDLLQVEKRIRGRVKKQMEKNQRDYYLNEQIKAIQKELGHASELPSELEELGKRIDKSGMPKEVKAKAKVELSKLKLMTPMSAEATVVRNYLDILLSVPWKKRSKIRADLKAAEDILEADHYGLEKVKERILEYLAVQQRVRTLKGPILCLVGPPGVGKTSLGQSIARATDRVFVRMALGGVRDEAEIRGHRRTYIGALPGKIIHNLSKAGTKNPLFLLDEIDKMTTDMRGDPASALLEVLDPEQNHTFNDHYLEVDVDLSEVMFVATANTLNIPPPLLDRMEVIRISGYTEDEKVNIAERYLIPKQVKNHGLKNGELVVQETAIRDIIRYYTREAGVRNLEREISKFCRKVVKDILLSKTDKERKAIIIPNGLEKYLGVKRFRYGKADERDQVGQVTGLAWTEVGGELLRIEAALVPGKGKLSYTGQLGDIMQESIQAAMTVVRSRTQTLFIDNDFYQKRDIHVHVPEGATPKDGPSAGIAMCTAIVSALTNIPIRASVAMTGEITLRGEVLPIGGLKEKLLAAHRGGVEIVLIPKENERDLTEIPGNIKNNLDIRPVRWMDEVLQAALAYMPVKTTDLISNDALIVETNEDDDDVTKVIKPSKLNSSHWVN
jgi:ATP-dependent Lon protease